MNQTLGPQTADLVLEGGGVKGIALVGAISVLEKRGYRFERVAGTSAGAIVGALAAAGVNAADMAEMMSSIDYRKFKDANWVDRLGPIGQGLSLMFAKGIYEGEYLRSWLGDRLREQGVERFGQLRRADTGSALAPEQEYKLVVMASDVSQGALRRLPWDAQTVYGAAPDELAVVDAVRASMSIPFFYEPVGIRHATTKQRTWLVDGGMLSNFPVGVFDRKDNASPRWPTFGIKLSAKPEDIQREKFKITGTLSLARALVGTMTSWYDHMHIDDPDVIARTIFVDTFGVRSTNFDLDEETADKLFESGQKSARRFLDGDADHPKWDFDEYKNRFRPGTMTGSG